VSNIHDAISLDTPVLSIMLVSYNKRDLTSAAFRSAYDQTSCNFEIVVVTNASTTDPPRQSIRRSRTSS
jgi:glycosyltransferase involved in cell wall biosynthesis